MKLSYYPLLILCLLLQFPLTSFGQASDSDSAKHFKNRINENPFSWKNQVTITGSYLHFPGVMQLRYDGTVEWFFDQIGIGYTRSISKHWNVGVSYNQWNDYLFKQIKHTPFVIDYDGSVPWGRFSCMLNYRMVDLIGSYALKISRRQYLNVGGGVSYYWGSNVSVDSLRFDSKSPNNVIVYGPRTPGRYLGAVGQAIYDYQLFKRISAGLNVAYRRYLSLSTVQVDYGLHISFYF